jgi:hypothetical protein
MRDALMNGKKTFASAIILFTLLLLADPIHAAECKSYKFIHVKIETGDTTGLAQFHGFEKVEEHEGFKATADSYDTYNVCGIFLHEKIGISTSWLPANDAAGILWANKLTKLNKDGSSIGGDLNGKYHLCEPETEITKTSCKCNAAICGTDMISGGSGPFKVRDQAYGPATQSKEGDLSTEIGDVSLSESETSYKPKYDILCGADDMRWHACDTPGCACVSNYACNDQGKWEKCQYGCDEAGKCKGNTPAAFCKNQEGLKAGDILEGSTAGCDMTVTVTDVYDVDAAVTIRYADQNTFERINAGGSWEKTMDLTTYTIEVKSLDPEAKTLTLYACCNVEPEPIVDPVVEPPPVKPKPKPPEPTPKPAEVIRPSYPESVCKTYYEVMTVKDMNTEKPEVKEPGECKYTETIEIEMNDSCKKIGGNLKDESYKRIDLPVCKGSGKTVLEMGKDIFGNPYDFEGERKRKLGVECDGGITDVTWEIKDDWLTGGEIKIWVDAMSGANASGDYGDKCEYQVCLYKSSGEEISCKGWNLRAEEESFQTEFSSTGIGSITFDTLLGWDILDLGGSFRIGLFSKSAIQPETNIENQTFELCRDGFLTLCTTTEEVKKYWIFPTNMTKDIYWGVESSEYSSLASKKGATNDTTWFLNDSLYMKMDIKTCIVSDASGTLSQMDYYTISNNPEYRKYVNTTYGNETYYKKYADMPPLDPDYLYCYKTDLRNTSRCKELNYNWYGFTGENVDETGITYREDLKEWNKNQIVDEISTLDMGRSRIAPSYEPKSCAISMDKDYYKGQDTITISYTNAGNSCKMTLYPWSADNSAEPVKEWTVGGSGTETYLLKEDDALGNYTVLLNCGDCTVKDMAYVNVSMIQNVMSRVFTVSPFLEDIRNSLTWTDTGNNTFYAGAGFVRHDICALSCNASDTDFRLRSGCTNVRGSDKQNCSQCINEGDCTVDSKGKCPDTKGGDCWKTICGIRTRNYGLEADPGQKGDSFHGVPYNGKCPAGFPKESREIGYYTRPADDERWSSDPSALEQGKQVTKCVLDGGVIATTTFEFSPPPEPAPLVDMVFVIDTSGSMDPEWESICGVINDVVKKLGEQGIDLKYAIFKLGGGGKPCGIGTVPNSGSEDWGLGIVWAANSYQWRSGARKIILPVSDEDLYLGDPRDSLSDKWISDAITAANTQKASVYGIIGDFASAAATSEMTEISAATKGKATTFVNSPQIAEALIEIALKKDYPAYAVSSNATIYMNQTAPNVWVLYQNVSQNATVNISKKKTSGEENLDSESKTEELKVEIYPSLLIVETANMPFNITYANITRSGSIYNLTRVYVPNETGEPYGKEFTVTSKLVVNYTLLETAETFILELNNSYFTQVRRDIDYVACNYTSCGGSGMNYKLAAPANDKPASCGNISTKGDGEIKTYRRETVTELLEKEYNETDEFKVDAVSHQDVLCSTLKQLKIEGTIDEYYDPQGNLVMQTSSEDPIKISITPDILSGFSFVVNDSAIVYSALYYPVRHQLTRKESAPYSDWEWRSPADKYGFQDERFGFPEQCKKTCPALKCTCPVNDPLNAKCTDFDTFELVQRTDCACTPRDCFPNPCVSNRTYHEEEGSVVANGDFETGNLSLWKKSDGGNIAEVVLSGHSGYMLRLQGGVEQILPNLSTNPYNKICIEYGLEEYSKDGSIDLTVTVDGKDKTFNVWKDSTECSDCLGWNKKCFSVDGYISKVKVESKTVAWIDNINLGKYYDYVGMSTYATARVNYMDLATKGWGSFGMLKTSPIAHVGNTYSFEVETLFRPYMDNRNFQISKDRAAAILSELEGAGKQASEQSLQELKKAFQENGVTLSKSVQIDKIGGGWRVTNGKRNYDIYKDSEGNINVVGMGFEYAAFSEADFKNGYIVLKTFFRDIYIPLSPNVQQSRKGEDPVCYDVDIKFRRPSKLSIDVSPNGYTLAQGTRITATYQLTFYDGTPIPNEKLYVDLAGANIWELSPEGVLKEYMFSFQEIGTKQEQQENLRDQLTRLGYPDIAEKLADAQYSQGTGNKLTITGKVSATIEVVNGVAHMKVDGKDIIIGVADKDGLIYESEENKLRAYVTTDANGKAKCSYIPTGTTNGVASPGGVASSPSSASIGTHVVSIKSPLFSREFLLLALILVLGVFSYRYFGNKKIDFYSWWRDFKGKK